ncbi:MAG TPA: hypothetical protein DCS87_00720 [Rheinheimera sp.]|nr:hypothetical protein [Rheinheimera sp.]
MKYLAILLMITTASSVHAAKFEKCAVGNTGTIQMMQDGRVYLRDSADVRHLLGDATDGEKTSLFMQLATHSLGKDLMISVAYPAGVSCEKPNDTKVSWLAVSDAKVGTR